MKQALRVSGRPISPFFVSAAGWRETVGTGSAEEHVAAGDQLPAVQLEGLGYVERRTVEAGDADRRLVYLTDNGWQIAEAIFGCLRRLQEEWAQEVGRTGPTSSLTDHRTRGKGPGKERLSNTRKGRLKARSTVSL